MFVPYFHCLACDCLLTEDEQERKYPDSSHYVGLCNGCFSEIEDDLNDDGDGGEVESETY